MLDARDLVRSAVADRRRPRDADRIILGQLQNRSVGSTSNTTGQAERKKHKNKRKTQYNATTTSDSEVTELRGQLIRYR
jgi:hypothetical protein